MATAQAQPGPSAETCDGWPGKTPIRCWNCLGTVLEISALPCLICGIELFCGPECRDNLNHSAARYRSVCVPYKNAKERISRFLDKMAKDPEKERDDYLAEFRPIWCQLIATVLDRDQVAGEGIIAVLELAVIYQFCYLITRKRAYILAAIQVTSQRIAIEDIDDYHKQLMLARQIFWAEDPDTATAILKAVTDPVYPRRIPLAKHARRSWISGDVHKYIRPTDTPRSIVSAYFRLEGDIPLTELKIGVCPGSLLDHAGVLALLITSQKYYKVFIQALKAQEVLASELPDAAARLVAKHLVDEKMFSKLVVKFTDSLKTNVVTWGRILPFLPISVPSGFSCDENSPSFARNETARRDLMVPFILSTLDYEAAHASHTPFGQKIQSQINEICLIGKEVHDRRKQAGRQGANP